MARIAFVADVHLYNHGQFGGSVEVGINARAREVLRTLQAAVETACDQKCDAFVVLGDLFDATKPPPQLLARVQDVLALAPNPILLTGNHDVVSDAVGDNALAPLRPVAYVAEKPEVVLHSQVQIALVPFRQGPPSSWLESTLRELAFQPGAILAMHVGIKDASTPTYLQAANAIEQPDLAALVDELEIGAVFAGDWHERRAWRTPQGAPILQVGTLCPTGFDNPGFEDYGFMAIWDTVTREGQSLSIPGPRFLKVRTAEELGQIVYRGRRTNDSVIVEAVAPPDKVAWFGELLREAVASGGITAGRVVIDKEVEREAAHKAARAASRADTLQEAIAAYVLSMELPEGVYRGALRERVEGFLK